MSTGIIARHRVIRDKLVRAFEALTSVTPLPAATAAARAGRLSRRLAAEIFESQLTSRLLDIEAREMKARGEGFYTIGSSGHEANACVAAALRPTDPCFLHYRSGPFMVQRSRQLPGTTPIFDTLLSLAASSEDPASGGRHKVWGSKRLFVPPQTSTIASHLPKAVGAAFAIGRTRAILASGEGGDLEERLTVEADAISVATFGDASINHSTAVGAVNAALWAAHQKFPIPVLFVCEDNDIGISVRTPGDWVASQYRNRSGLGYYAADGLDMVATYEAARNAVEHCRDQQAPVFLHLKTVRLMGHAGSDVELTYRTLKEIEAVEAADPLVRSARFMVEQGWMTAAEITALDLELEERIASASREASRRPKITSTADVVEPLAPLDREAVAAEASRPPESRRRLETFGSAERLPEASDRPRHMAMLINWALHDLMAKYDEMLVFGEDVAKKGGVYHVTNDLYERFGAARVFNTLLDEQTILGVAIGAAHVGYLPCPEIQYLAYLVHASDQLRGEACSLQFFSDDQYRNPMVVRVAGLAYQKGFGGHFHNDNGFAFLREIPGLVLACPSRGDDAVRMLRTCFAAARECGRVVVFMEPIALYMTKDLHAAGDGEWSFPYPGPGESVEIGTPRVHDCEGEADLTIITYGNGVWMSLRVAARLRAKGHAIRVVDLRWLMPLNEDVIVTEAGRAPRVLVVDEGRSTAGIGEQVVSIISERCEQVPKIARTAGVDCYIPLAEAADLVLVSENSITAAAEGLLA